ncbi:iron complex outermembrane receptor protein [Sphingomonas kyeonggiensis]|uniref:Iron complex outermembrane receptor protein n=1 Tax=Sphingomonas kyeonggiensis TaxID=1268553 RepID=A0A7W7K544_9SPHN|nr:TonB-dependent receptor [Sphingomonas kyeonggiensis]MBB4841148.1 iron complex outermembrane receptor protein [Sphingomonas kyeonggiensis]
MTRFLRGSTALCGAMLIAMPAYAQEAAAPAAQATSGPTQETPAPAAQEDTGEAIVVTGSLFRRTNTETPSPVTVLSAEALEQRGLNTVTEAVQRISAGNAGTITQGWNAGGNFAVGASAISLRGLTVQATLTIFDGMRMAPYPLADDGQRNFVDLNTIPSAIIERIEVLKDGASSTYGADAVAGVINVITKKEIKGLHANVSAGISQRGDGAENRGDLTWGFGDLSEQGFNFYVSGEYMKQDPLWARDRDYPFNTYDWGKMCNGNGGCMHNLNWNGISPDGSVNALWSTPGVALVRPVLTPGAPVSSGRYSYLNPARGCGAVGVLRPLTAGQLADTPSAPTNGLCEVNQNAAYLMVLPEVERMGASARFTANIGDSHQFYAQGNYYKTSTFAQATPSSFAGQPTNPTSGAEPYYVILPVYVCANGVGTLNGVGTGCDATNGTLNPYNPYAAAGQTAQVSYRMERPTSNEAVSRSIRGVIGMSGTIGGFDYAANFVAANSKLTRTQSGYVTPQRIMDVVARGTFNFSNPSATPQSVLDYISPDSLTVSNSDLWQASANVSRHVIDLPGGGIEAAAGASYRYESIMAPSANPQNDAHPYDRYYTINSVGTSGSRKVFSAFGEIQATALDLVELNLSGRYDSYSTGQKNFSPKVGGKITPIKQVALRGTWSKGFRIPSFNEAFGLPTTGFVSQGGNTAFCQNYVAFCNAHGGPNSSYASSPFSVGLTNVGNPNLKPEKSESLTAGVIFEPIRGLSFTVDFWRIQVKDQIVGVSGIGPVLDQYYTNNGVVNIPGFVVTPGTVDPANPNALPHIGYIQASYTNANRQIVQGIDFSANANIKLTDGIRWISSADVSYLDKNHLTLVDPFTGEAGEPQRYEDTLSPCNVTSCSGSPRWRASWQNTFQFGGTSVTATAYYTAGYHVAAVDYNAIPFNCESAVARYAATYDDGTPVQCRSKDVWNVDLTIQHKLNDNFALTLNVLNLLDTKPPFDPNAAYGGYGYNPAWAGPNIMGRYFRVGTKLDF